MRNLTLLVLFTFVLSSFGFSQNTYFSTPESIVNMDHNTLFDANTRDYQKEYIGHEYGIFWGVTYDREGYAYGVSNVNHILISEDGGYTWDVFYSYEINYVDLRNLTYHYVDGKDYLYFTASVSGTNEINAVYALNMATKEIEQKISSSFQKIMTDYELDPFNDEGILVLESGGNGITEDRYNRLFYSPDNGETITLIRDQTNQDYKTFSAFFDPFVEGRIYLALTYPGGILISNDYGSTWSDIDLDGYTMRFVKPHPTEEGVVFAGTGVYFAGVDGQKFYRSTDHGETWEEIPMDLKEGLMNAFLDITPDPHNPNVLFMTDDVSIFRSDDYGKSWTATHYEDEAEYFYATNIGINPKDSNNLLMNGTYRVIASKDRGKTLDAIDVPFHTTFNTKYAKYSNGDEYLFYSSLSSYFVENLSTGERLDDFIYGMVGFDYYYLPDPDVKGRVFFARVNQIGNMVLFYSNDYGHTLSQVEQQFGSESIQDMKVDPHVPNRYWISNRIDLIQNELLKVTVVGDEVNVEQIFLNDKKEGLITSIDLSPTEKDVIYISVNHEIKKSVDAGYNWEVISEGLPLAGVWDITINPHDPDHIIASLSLGEGVYATYDGGSHWEPVFLDYEIKDISFIPEKEDAVVGRRFGYAGLIYSEDGGESWTHISEVALDYVLGGDFTYRGTEEDVTVYVSTADLGILELKIPWMNQDNPFDGEKNTENTSDEDDWIQLKSNQVESHLEVAFNDLTPGKMTLSRMDGSVVRTVNVNSYHAKMPLTDQPKGMYIIRYTADDGRVWSEKVFRR